MHPLTSLMCQYPTSGGIGQVVAHLADTLDRLLVKSYSLQKSGDETEIALFGPFLGRAIIEVSFTALMARFDAFRVLAIRQSQISASYDLRHRNSLAFNWALDVQGEEKAKEWEQRPVLRELQRALFSKHCDDIFWREAFLLLLDSVPMHRGDGWMSRLNKIPPESFVPRMRSEADQMYTQLSKGIHHEFVVPMTAQYDPHTVADLLNRAWELVAGLGLAASYAPSVKSLTVDALECYEQAQKELLT